MCHSPQGLSFLHSRFIAHRVRRPSLMFNSSAHVPQDIKRDNIVVNHFLHSQYIEHNLSRQTLRSQGKLVYCWIDFGFSVMFSPTSLPSERRLSTAGDYLVLGCNYTHDTSQGEIDYDPFADDVGSLGQLFCEQFQVQGAFCMPHKHLTDFLCTSV
jgi:hypothetical protein